MANKGSIKKGQRLSPKTEFKKGEHAYRKPKPHWEKGFWMREYVKSKKTIPELAKELGIRNGAVSYWLKKHDIPTRTVSETRSIKHWGLSGKDNPMYGKTKDKNHNWKGGCTPERQAFYTSQEWAKACFTIWKRDNAECQQCGIKSDQKKLHVHHIVSFAVKELRAVETNLVLLCVNCHRWVHSKKNIDQLFIKRWEK